MGFAGKVMGLTLIMAMAIDAVLTYTGPTKGVTSQHSKTRTSTLVAITGPSQSEVPEVPPDEVPNSVLNWRVERSRLSHACSQEIFRRRARYLPFARASSWAQTLGLSSKEDWLEWLEQGEDRTAYVPMDPEAYYLVQGSWLGWKIFLTGAA